MAKHSYKTIKYLNCPYCNLREERVKMVSHIENKHPDLIPEGYTAARIVFNALNKKEHGTCIICGNPTEWDEKVWKYKRICNKKSCSDELRNRYKTNMERAGKSIHLSDDPERLKKMIAGRSISGEYKFTDGGIRSYTGSYERKCLEFFDKVLEVHSRDIITPGPTFEYEYEGQKHLWITDIYYTPANLVIEVKDGGDNPNNREMKSYREKQIAKEAMITSLGKYNYLRLTNNNFTQLFEILATLKEKMLDGDKSVVININEEVGGLPPQHPLTDRVYVIPYGFNNVFSGNIEGLGFTNSLFAENILTVENGIIRCHNTAEFLKERVHSFYEFKLNSESRPLYEKILRAWKDQTIVSENFFYEILSGKTAYSEDAIMYDRNFSQAPIISEVSIKNGIIEGSLKRMVEMIKEGNISFEFPILNENVNSFINEIIDCNCTAKIKEDPDGYFLEIDRNTRTKSYDSLDAIMYAYKMYSEGKI